MFFSAILAGNTLAQKALTWQEVRVRFEAANPSLRAAQIGMDIDRSENLIEAARAQVFSDVDSAYSTVNSTVVLLQPYKDRYLQQASRIRDTIAFSYEHGAASLLDFLNAQADYRSVQVNYLNLVAAYLDAANQLNLAVGREVIQ
jgi:cobalt-zinc-cadmium efflux system outer membrane protein